MPSLFNRLFQPAFPFEPKRLPFFYGWLVALGATLGTLFSIPGQTMGFSVFTEILMGEFKLSRVTLSLAYLVGTIASGLTLPKIGQMFDQYGARKMIVLSSVATGLILLYLSESADVARVLSAIFPAGWQTAISFLVIGLGFYLIRLSAQGILSMTSRNAIGKWFNVQRGMAMAISGIFVSIGFSIAPIVLNLLIDRFEYDGAWRLLALLTICVMAPLGWLIFRDNPEECDLTMDGPGADSAPKNTNPDMVIHRDYTRKEAVSTFSFHAFNLSLAFFSMFSTAYTFHIESIGAEFGFEKADVIKLFLPIAVTSVVISLLFGWLNSKTKLKYMLLTMNIGSVLSSFGLLKLETGWGPFVYVIGSGISVGIFSSLMGVVWPRFYGRQFLGAISGLVMSGMVIASGIGPWLFAFFQDLSGSYRLILGVCISIPAALCVASLFADNPQRNENPS